MKCSISKFSPHKTALTVASVFAVTSLLFVLPFALMFAFIPQTDGNGNEVKAGLSAGLFFVMPVFYFVFGYIGTAFSSWVYNRITKFTGGISIEITENDA